MNKPQNIEQELLNLAVTHFGQRKEELDLMVQMMAKWVGSQVNVLYQKLEATQKDTLLLLADKVLADKVRILPEHAIIHAQPSDNNSLLTSEQLFTFNPPNGAEISLSPLGNYPLVQGKVKYMVSASGVDEMLPSLKKKTIITPDEMSRDSNFLWLGIDYEEEWIKEELVLYLHAEKETELVSILPYCKWTLEDDSPISIKQGLPLHSVSETENHLERLEHPMRQLEEQIQKYYDPNFIKLNWKSNNLSTKKRIPQVLKRIFPTMEEKVSEALLWIKIELPGYIESEEVKELYCMLNCVPVLQRKLEKIVLNPSNQIALQTTFLPEADNPNQFLGIEQIQSGNHGYTSNTYALQERPNEGKYVLKHNALSEQEESTKQYQLMLKPTGRESEKILVKYWTTKGPLKIAIPKGALLRLRQMNTVQAISPISLEGESVFLVTSLIGGRPAFDNEEKMTCLKSFVLSKEYFLTREDFKTASLAYLGRFVKTIQLTKGLTTFPGPNIGLIRTLDIMVSPTKEGFKNQNRLLSLMQSLQILLETKSIIQLPIRVLLEGQLNKSL